MKFTKIIENVAKVPNSEPIMREITAIIEEHLCTLMVTDKKTYHQVMTDVYIAAYGPHFCEEKAVWAVSQMVNSDGTTGQHWAEADTTRVAKSVGVTFMDYNEWDWYFVMNMMYSDYYKIFGSTDSNYINLAKAFLEDVDAPKGKAFYYFKAMHSV